MTEVTTKTCDYSGHQPDQAFDGFTVHECPVCLNVEEFYIMEGMVTAVTKTNYARRPSLPFSLFAPPTELR